MPFPYTVIRSQSTAIEADTAEDAIKKVLNGEGTSSGASFNVQIRPQQPKTPNAPVTTPNT